ncbi:MAG: NADH-quinone oxidoreductase subunit NuoE [Sandaracinaceae bacterium]|nr:NADH-quinone oxidoreductase subunit NuoE [Sandaracinaceae bacterium]
MAFALTPEREKQAAALLDKYPERRAALLPLLWLCQRQNGYISDEVIAFVAEKVGLETAEVKGVVTFYTMFFQEPVGEHVIWVCRTLACDLRGGKAVQEHLQRRLGVVPGQTTRDGKFTLLKAECLASCGSAPMVQIDDDYHENLTAEKLDRILDEIAAGPPWVEGATGAASNTEEEG